MDIFSIVQPTEKDQTPDEHLAKTTHNAFDILSQAPKSQEYVYAIVDEPETAYNFVVDRESPRLKILFLKILFIGEK